MHKVCYVFQPLDCLSRLNWEWTLYRRIWVTKSWLTKESDCHQKNLILILICDAKTRFLMKKKREIKWIVLATGLSLYAEQRVDFVKEMGD